MVDSAPRAARLRGDPGRHRPDRAADRGDPHASHPDAYVGTPSFLRIIVEKAQRNRSLDISNLKRALRRRRGAAAEPARVVPRAGRRDRAAVVRHRRPRPGRLRVGGDGGHDPRRGPDPGDRAPGHRRAGAPTARSARWSSPASTPDYPMIRFGTGDLSAVLPGASPCGRTNVRIKGLDGARRPDRPRCAACSCIRGRSPRSSGATRRDRPRAAGDRPARWPTIR